MVKNCLKTNKFRRCYYKNKKPPKILCHPHSFTKLVVKFHTNFFIISKQKLVTPIIFSFNARHTDDPFNSNLTAHYLACTWVALYRKRNCERTKAAYVSELHDVECLGGNLDLELCAAVYGAYTQIFIYFYKRERMMMVLNIHEWISLKLIKWLL